MQTLKERKRKINENLIRKDSAIEDLLFSSRNAITVEEELGQFNHLFKMLLYTKSAMGCCMKKRDNRMMNGSMKLMPKHFHSKGKYMPG